MGSLTGGNLLAIWLLQVVIGIIVGSFKSRPLEGAIWAFFLGPLGWLIIGLGPDLGRKCPKCKGPIPANAVKCKNCTSDLEPENKQEKIEHASFNNTKKCPFCAEQIKLEAIVCRFCKKDLPMINVEEEKQIFEAKKLLSVLSKEDTVKLESLMKLTLKQRTEKCFACGGKSDDSCGMCESREKNITDYLEATKILGTESC